MRGVAATCTEGVVLQVVQKCLNTLLGQGGSADHHFQAVVFGWIVTAGDHDARAGL